MSQYFSWREVNCTTFSCCYRFTHTSHRSLVRSVFVSLFRRYFAVFLSNDNDGFFVQWASFICYVTMNSDQKELMNTAKESEGEKCVLRMGNEYNVSGILIGLFEISFFPLAIASNSIQCISNKFSTFQCRFLSLPSFFSALHSLFLSIHSYNIGKMPLSTDLCVSLCIFE